MSVGWCDVCSVNAVCGRLDVNVALNRPTSMSSVHYNAEYGYFPSWKANDGNTDPVALKPDQDNNSCVCTVYEFVAHWWAVDLGVPLSVTGVLFFNRAEDRGNIDV